MPRCACERSTSRDAKGFVAAELKNAGPGREYAVTWAIAQGFFEAKAFNQAAQYCTLALALAGKQPDAGLSVELMLGDAYSRLGEQDKAVEVYQSSLKKHPDHLLLGSNLAWLLNQRPGQSEAAFTLLERVRRGPFSQKPIGGDRLSLDFLNIVGVVYRDARHYKEAIAVLEAALDRYKDEPQLHLYLGRAYAGRNRTADANQHLDAAAKLADKRARSAADADSRASWLALATEARQDMNTPK